MHEAPLPKGVPTGMLGAYAISKLSVLTGDYHLSKREASSLLFDFYGLDVSLGTVVNAEQIVSESVAAPVEEAKEYVKVQPVVNADETGHKEQGKRYWTWVAVASSVAVFLIRASRGAKIAKELLGESFLGTLISDRCAAYAWVKKRQLCWSHLIRDFVKIAERSGAASRVGLFLLAYSKRLFRYWHRFREGKFTRQRLQELMQGVIRQIEFFLLQGTACGESKTQNTCKRLLKLKSALWTFVLEEGIEPTNNLAERTIRPLVIWRKKSFGTQSENGSRYLERIMTVASSCRLHGRNVLDFVEQSVQAYFNQQKSPSLLPSASLTRAIEIAA
jgi:transposase